MLFVCVVKLERELKVETMNTVYMAFANQKGGVGKTLFTTLVASYLHYLTKINVVVVDADYPQYSIVAARNRDLDLIQRDEYFKRLAYNQFSVIQKQAYPILKSIPAEAIKTADDYLQNKIPNVILFDLPGTVQSEGVLKTLAGLDYIFIPISADRLVLESSLSFARTIQKAFVNNKSTRLKQVFLFWNQVDARENKSMYEVYGRIIRGMNLVLLESHVRDTKSFRKEILQERRIIFRSTLFPASKRFAHDSNVEALVLEIAKTVLA